MIELLKKEKFIGLLRNVPIEKTEEVAWAMYKGGVRIFEVTYNPSKKDTVKTVEKQFEILKSSLNDIGICAGTVVFPELVTAAKKCGAKAIVSPNVNLDVIKLTKENKMLSIPGAYTPSEIAYAYDAGADIVKVFPVLPNDILYLKTVMSPLSHIPFITTGGVNPDTINSFLEAGALAVAAGASVVKPELLKENDYKGIEYEAKRHIDEIKNAYY